MGLKNNRNWNTQFKYLLLFATLCTTALIVRRWRVSCNWEKTIKTIIFLHKKQSNNMFFRLLNSGKEKKEMKRNYMKWGCEVREVFKPSINMIGGHPIKLSSRRLKTRIFFSSLHNQINMYNYLPKDVVIFNFVGLRKKSDINTGNICTISYYLY